MCIYANLFICSYYGYIVFKNSLKIQEVAWFKYHTLVLNIREVFNPSIKVHCLFDYAFSVIFIEDTEYYIFFFKSPDTYILGAKHFLMWLRPEIITLWGSPLSWLSGCWLHSPGGSSSGQEARTHQSRKARAQLHDGHSADKKSKLLPLNLQGNISVFFQCWAIVCIVTSKVTI